jgi:hypothetical protein
VTTSTATERRPRLRQGTRLIALLGTALLLSGLAATPVLAARPTEARGSGGVQRTIAPKVPDRSPAVVVDGSIGVKSSVGYAYGDGSIAIVGEVLNRTSARRKAVTINIAYYNGTGGQIGTASDTVLLIGVAEGATGPFVVFDPTPPDGVDTYIITNSSGTTTSTAPGGGLDLTLDSSNINGEVREYHGTLRNPNSFAVADPFVMLTGYNAAGDVVEVNYDATSADPVPAHGSVTFQIDVSKDLEADPDPDFKLTKVGFVADGFKATQLSVYITSWSNYFDDIANSSFRTDIIWLAEQHITTGCGAGKFCPTADVRRDEMASFLARGMGLVGTAPDAFTDDNGNTHEANINRIAMAGVTSGCKPNLFCPTEDVRRDAMASFLARALELVGTAPNAFTDDNGNTHEANINLVAQAGITSGCGPTTYCPTQNVTRGQMSAFLKRAFEQ